MNRLAALSLLLLAGYCYASERIVGGNPTTIDQYPSIVQVEFLTSGIWVQGCAASILNSFAMLSAASCFHGENYEPSLRRIRAGTTHRSFGGRIVGVLAAFNHPTWGTNQFEGDISVVRLSTPLIMTDFIQPTPISGQGTVIPAGLSVAQAGWGLTAENGVPSPILLDVQLLTINNAICHERYQTLPEPVTITSNMICTGLLDVGGRDACQGDYGGPLYFGSTTVGVISYGQRCGNASFPGVSTAVGSYTNWIVEMATTPL